MLFVVVVVAVVVGVGVGGGGSFLSIASCCLDWQEGPHF